jgi:hypothetical protein
MATDTVNHEALNKQANRGWKQWFLVYPSFAIAVVGAVPQYINVVKGAFMGVDSSAVAYAEEQRRLFIRNIDCNLSLETVTTQTNSNIAVGACPTGDIQVNIQYPNGERVVQWFAFEKFTPHQASLWSSFIGKAMASDLPMTGMRLAQQNIQVICQREFGKGKLLRRVEIENQCFDQVINIYTGAVEKQTPASCDKSC